MKQPLEMPGRRPNSRGCLSFNLLTDPKRSTKQTEILKRGVLPRRGLASSCLCLGFDYHAPSGPLWSPFICNRRILKLASLHPLRIEILIATIKSSIIC